MLCDEAPKGDPQLLFHCVICSIVTLTAAVAATSTVHEDPALHPTLPAAQPAVIEL
jgi:hypothetical protein